MIVAPGRILVVFAGCLIVASQARADEPKAYNGAGCAAAPDDYFRDEVWTKVVSQKCLTCHKAGGDAEETRLVLSDPEKSPPTEQPKVLRENRDVLVKMARVKEGKQFRLLVKVTGGLDHGGGDVLPSGSAGHRIMAEFVRRVNTSTAGKPAVVASDDKDALPYFAGVPMLDDRSLLRRATLSLAGRLPTEAEDEAVARGGLKALPKILDGVMQEEAFYDRLREGFNDIFLTLGVIGNPDQVVLSYEYFKTRQWFIKADLSHIKDEKDRRLAGYKMADDFRTAVLGEPMKLVEYIVRNSRPFTEIVTADYMMVTPYTARGYGCFDELKDQFKDVEDPFEYLPVRLKALEGRSPRTNQESATGYYPHAGLLSAFQYLRRYPTTETNRNRLRARMYYQHFLGVDLLELAARVADAAAVSAKYEIPTMQASECVVCHKTMDPVAGLFQDFYDFEGTYGRRKDGWYKDIFAAGFEGEDLPPEERWRALQWLGERTVKDPRFAVAMVEHVYYILTGRKALLPPKDLEDPLFDAKHRAYEEQRRVIEAIAVRFAKADFNLKQAFKDWVVSDFYRVDGIAPTASEASAARLAELDDVGVVRMLTPEQLERKTGAIFGQRWGKLNGQLGMLYGGIDSKEVTERAADPSGAMGAIQRILANEMGRNRVAPDFAKPPAERVLFPGIESDVLPGASPEADAQINRAVVYLHERILGRHDAGDSPDVKRTQQLFADIVTEARTRKESGVKDDGPKSNFFAPNDPNYTIRAWQGVVTYLLRRPEFLYE